MPTPTLLPPLLLPQNLPPRPYPLRRKQPSLLLQTLSLLLRKVVLIMLTLTQPRS